MIQSLAVWILGPYLAAALLVLFMVGGGMGLGLLTAIFYDRAYARRYR